MRLFALRGRNLASLPQFDVDFEKGPLADAGLFAISGPTGAGKSTLLDALCLALFDRVPRLRAAARTAPGMAAHAAAKDTLSDSDPRAVMRRGTAEAMSEVEFEGQDRQRYKATWHARRAYGKADGKLQDTQMTLVNVRTGENLSGRKTETLARIEAVLGLQFEQFCRSVLLAQGEFAAFVRARANERAELLEKMTGTEIYALLSKEAFAQAKDRRVRLDEHLRGLDRLACLADADRAALEARGDAARVAQEAIAQDVDRARSRIEALKAWQAHGRARDEKERARADARAVVNGHERLAARVSQVRAAEDLRPLFLLHDERAQDAKVAALAFQAAQSSAEHALARVLAGRAHAEDAARAERGLKDAILARAPEVERARQLDALLSQREQALFAARAACTQATARVRDAASRHARALDDCARLKSQVGSSLRAIRTSAGHLLETLKTVEAEGLRARDALAQAQTQRESFEASMAAADKALAEALAEAPPATLLADQSRVSDLRHLCAGLAEHLSQVQGHQERAEEARRAISIRKERLNTLEAERAALFQDSEDKGRALDAALSDLTLARAAADVAVRRRELLVPGHPCPLCGSVEHPDAHKPAHQDSLVAALEAHCDQLRARALEVRQALQCAETRMASERTALAVETAAERDAAHARDEVRTRAVEAMSKLCADAPEFVDACQADLDITDARVAERLRRIMDGCDERSAALQAIQARQDGLRASCAATRTARDAGEADVRRWMECREGLKGRYLETKAACERMQTRIDRLQRLEVLFAPHAAAAGDASTSSTGAKERASASAAPLENTDDDALEIQIHSLMSSLASIRTQVAETRAHEAERAAHASGLEKDRDETRAERAALLEGQSVDGVLTAHADSLESASAGLGAARDALARLEQEHSASEQAVAVHAARVEECARAVPEIKRRLEERCAALGLDDVSESPQDSLRDASLASSDHERGGGMDDAWEARGVMGRARACLRLGPAWCAAQEALIQKARTELMVLDASCAHLAAEEAHLRARVAPELFDSANMADTAANTDAALSELEARLASLEAQRASHLQTMGSVRRELELDGARRLERAQAERALDADRESARRWEALAKVIGSREGDTFRRFAQGVTLEVLLEHANAHLRLLRPRYRLTRAPGTEMDLQVVDTDLGDETRALATLSGGETFLVSLALALGLSSLSSRDLRIDSLFIDEGFGTLDAEALEQALSVLDIVQSDGRKIGLISHVPGIVERLGVRIAVHPQGPGKSLVRVLSHTEA